MAVKSPDGTGQCEAVRKLLEILMTGIRGLDSSPSEPSILKRSCNICVFIYKVEPVLHTKQVVSPIEQRESVCCVVVKSCSVVTENLTHLCLLFYFIFLKLLAAKEMECNKYQILQTRILSLCMLSDLLDNPRISFSWIPNPPFPTIPVPNLFTLLKPQPMLPLLS